VIEAIAGDTSGPRHRIRPEEPAQFDPAMLESLCRRIGETRAEAEVARALERISTTLSALETLSEHARRALHGRDPALA
jgi:hypothetical protein